MASTSSETQNNERDAAGKFGFQPEPGRRPNGKIPGERLAAIFPGDFSQLASSGLVGFGGDVVRL
jgi:hypothetical protein